MYAVIIWLTDDYVTFIRNADGSIRLFNTIAEADALAEGLADTRVISIQGVEV